MIALCPNPFRDLDLKLTRDCLALLEQAGFSCVICPVFAEDEPEALPADLQYQKLAECCGADTELSTSYVGPRSTLSMRRQGKYRSPLCTDKETRALRNFPRASQFKGSTAGVQAWLTTRIAMANNQYFILREFTTQNS